MEVMDAALGTFNLVLFECFENNYMKSILELFMNFYILKC